MKLAIENLSCRRGERIIFKNLNFSLKAGESLLLTGPNGSGKTTLLRTIAGYMPVAAGHIKLEEPQNLKEIGEQVHFVGHLNGIKHAFTVEENLRFWSNYFEDKHTNETINTALNIFELENLRKIPSGLLSAGQKRRLCLARLLVAKRPLWLLDEPTVSLDKNSQNILTKLISKHVADNGLVIVTTHIPLELEFSKSLDLVGRLAEE